MLLFKGEMQKGFEPYEVQRVIIYSLRSRYFHRVRQRSLRTVLESERLGEHVVRLNDNRRPKEPSCFLHLN